jgi:hypothetical protein
MLRRPSSRTVQRFKSGSGQFLEQTLNFNIFETPILIDNSIQEVIDEAA